MSSMDTLAKDLYKVMHDEEKGPKPYEPIGVVTKNDDKNEDTLWVKIPGSEFETPVEKTINANPGDRVRLRVSGGRAWVIGNASNPPTDDSRANEIGRRVGPSINFVNGLLGQDISVHSITASVGYIDDLYSKNITTENIWAATGYIDDLYSKNITTENIQATNGYIQHLVAEDILAEDITADHATIEHLDTTFADIRLANVNNAWIEDGVIKDAAISDAQIIGVSANKLTAGTIDASNINVTNLNADNITTGSITVDGITIDVENNSSSIDGAYIEDGTITMNGFAQEVKDVIDGAIETYTGAVVPTLNNAPANAWTTTKLKDQHIGDVYYVVNASSEQNGYCYRFTKSSNTYSWQLIKDSDVTAALSRLTTAEGKITGLESFESTTSSWMTETDEELSSVKSRTTTLEANVEAAHTYFATCGTSASTAVKVATITPELSDFTLRNGMTVIVNFSATNSNSNATLNLNNTGAKPIRYKGATLNSTTRGYLAANRLVILQYDGTYWQITGATTDANTYDRTQYKASLTATGPIAAGHVGVIDADGHIMSLSTTPFNVSAPILYIGTAYTATALTQTNNYSMYGTPFPLATTKSGFTGDVGKPVYIVGTLNGNMFTPDEAIFTTTVPTSADNKHYILFGLMSTATNATLNAEHPIFTYGANGFAGIDVNNQKSLTTKVETSVFNTVSQKVDENSASITSLSSVVDTKADNSTVTTLSNTVNTVSQTATGNSSKLSQLTNTLGTNEDGTTKVGDIMHRATAVEQDLSGFKTTVSETYATNVQMRNIEGLNISVRPNGSNLIFSATVTQAGIDITDTLPDGDFEWYYRKPTGDELIFVNGNVANGKTLTLPQSSQVYGQTVVCVYTRNQYTNLLTSSGGRLLTNTGDYLIGRSEY